MINKTLFNSEYDKIERISITMLGHCIKNFYIDSGRTVCLNRYINGIYDPMT